MIERPSQLYTSKEFRGLRSMLMVERTKADGILYCEHCGKPILQGYDCIAHHIKEITPANLNDVAITLNPDNIALVHHKCHNEIHERFGNAAYRKVYYVYGAPCSGKSTYVRENKGNNDIIIDIDNIWESVTGRRYYKPNALKQYVFAMYRELLEQIKMTNRTGGKGFNNAWVIEGGARAAERMRRIDVLGAEPIFINTDITTCLERLASDVDRQLVQDEWSKYIHAWFEDYQDVTASGDYNALV